MITASSVIDTDEIAATGSSTFTLLIPQTTVPVTEKIIIPEEPTIETTDEPVTHECFEVQGENIECFKVEADIPVCFAMSLDYGNNWWVDDSNFCSLATLCDDTFGATAESNMNIPPEDEALLVSATGIHAQGRKIFIFDSWSDTIFWWDWSENYNTDDLDLYGLVTHQIPGLINSSLDIYATSNADSQGDILIGVTDSWQGAYGHWVQTVTFLTKTGLITGRLLEGESGSVQVPSSNEPHYASVKLSCSPVAYPLTHSNAFYGNWNRHLDEPTVATIVSTRPVYIINEDWEQIYFDNAQLPPPNPDGSDVALYREIHAWATPFYAKNGNLVCGIGQELYKPIDWQNEEDVRHICILMGGATQEYFTYSKFYRALDESDDTYKLTECVYEAKGHNATTWLVDERYAGFGLNKRVDWYFSGEVVCFVGTMYDMTETVVGETGLWYCVLPEAGYGRHVGNYWKFQALESLGLDRTLAGSNFCVLNWSHEDKPLVTVYKLT